MANLKWILALALGACRSAAAGTTTTLANCQSACNLGEMLCLNKNASATLCSAIQGACMAGCYASHVDCGCADASVTHCAKEFALRHLSAEVLVGMCASLSALLVVVLGKAMPPCGVAADPVTDGGTREPRRSAPRSRVAAASRGRLRTGAAGEPSGGPPGNARPGFVYIRGVLSCKTCTSS